MRSFPFFAARQSSPRHRLIAAWVAVFIGWGCGLAHAQGGVTLDGVKQVWVQTRDGQRIDLGTLRFTPQDDGRSRFVLSLNPAIWRDYFLSMKEFKCLPADAEVSCHVPYPYANPATVAPGDYAWLELSLLFLFKTPAEFGAKLWNGVYFALQAEGDRLVGVPMAVDLNHISAPPDDPGIPPLGPLEREPYPAGARWISRLVIQ
ncbi:MAG: hypothetical protein OHK0048_13910 [Rhodoferax sp.]